MITDYNLWCAIWLNTHAFELVVYTINAATILYRSINCFL